VKEIQEELERVTYLESLTKEYNEETVKAIEEAIEHPETLHKLKSWEELGL
jgi:hypothetical protein